MAPMDTPSATTHPCPKTTPSPILTPGSITQLIPIDARELISAVEDIVAVSCIPRSATSFGANNWAARAINNECGAFHF